MARTTPIVVEIELSKTTLTEAEARVREEALRQLVQELVTKLELIPEGYIQVNSGTGTAEK